jgi:ceramide synthetase
MIYHAIEEVRNDYIEMLLHHFVTLFLYSFSYLTNLTTGGAIIMFLHDWADIPTSSVKCWTETRFSSLSFISAMLMAVSWFYTRILVFP